VRRGSLRLFGDADLLGFTRQLHENMQTEVRNTEDDYLLNVNETEFVQYLVGKYELQPVVLDIDGLHVTEAEREIPADKHPSSFAFMERESFPRQVVTYHVPFLGNADLLRCRASTFLMWSMEVEIRGGCISFEIINFRNDAAEVKRQADHILGNLKTQVGHLADDVAVYNRGLADQVRSVFLGRKKTLLERGDFLAALGVPVKKRTGASSTFSVPVQRTKVVVKPSAPSETFQPEPTLDEPVYQSVLKMIHDYGVEMERHPAVYADKGEEPLRDHLIMMLSPHFQSATGETFNKSGKTDILIRHEGKNVFVAECKFWRGIKAYHATLDQLLGYLTWRDSKTAVVCFVDNRELAPVLQQVEEKTAEHACFIKALGKRQDGWLEYEFHLKDDNSRGVRLAVLCFHFPKTEEEIR